MYSFLLSVPHGALVSLGLVEFLVLCTIQLPEFQIFMPTVIAFNSFLCIMK